MRRYELCLCALAAGLGGCGSEPSTGFEGGRLAGVPFNPFGPPRRRIDTRKVGVTPGCDGAVSFTASGTGLDGQPINQCTWVFDGLASQSKNICTGTIWLSPGPHSAVVTFGEGAYAETRTFTSVLAYDRVTAAATLSGDCLNQLGYTARAAGGSGNYSYAWSFTPLPAGVDVHSSGKLLTEVAAADYTGVVIVTDYHDGVTCPATASAAAAVHNPLKVRLSGSAPVGCTSDAARFTVQVEGGSGMHSTAFTGCTSSVGDLCAVDPPDMSTCAMLPVMAHVTDPVCGNQDSNRLHYSKLTSVTVAP